jgi:protein-S-isoprenylcysteine O-methyltransferase Ste14
VIALVDPQPTTLLALGALGLCMAAFLVSLILARANGKRGDEAGATRAVASWAGIGVQGLGFAAVGIGPLLIRLDPYAPVQIGEALGVLVLAGVTLFLFVASTRAMGRNWSLVARTREDHQLVTWGPFARVRHPIYTGLFTFMIAMAIAFGHYRGLIVGMPLYWLGTWIRVGREERLLRARFGAAYDAYAARVKRFVPGLI